MISLTPANTTARRRAPKILSFVAIAIQIACVSPASAQSNIDTAIFAGGCFWCMEPPFDKLDGVLSTTSGYTGGDIVDPSYEQVSAGTTGHYEAVSIEYDTTKISYEELLEVFWRNIDPLDARGQFCDRGDQYRAAVFYANPEQERLARESRRRLEDDAGLPAPIVTEILPASAFYPAEEYHQNYYEKNPVRYRFYRFTCGRDDRLAEVWDRS